MRFIWTLAAVVALAAPAPVQSRPEAAELAARLQRHYETVRDFTAEFTQTTHSGLLPQATVESGVVKVKKPGRMRWTYESPQKKIVGADGEDLYLYVAEDRVVTYVALPAPDEALTALLFLTGHGNLTRDFRTHLPADQPDGEWHLLMTPVRPQDDFDLLTLMVDRRTLAFVGIETRDEQGGRSTIRFTRYRENVGLRDGEFDFVPPRGVEAIRR